MILCCDRVVWIPFFMFCCSLRGLWLRVTFLPMWWCMCCTASIASNAAPKKPLAARLKTCGSLTFQREWLRLKPVPLKAALFWQVFPFLIQWQRLRPMLLQAALLWQALLFLIPWTVLQLRLSNSAVRWWVWQSHTRSLKFKVTPSKTAHPWRAFPFLIQWQALEMRPLKAALLWRVWRSQTPSLKF